MLRKSLLICVFIVLLVSTLSAQWNTEIIDNSPTSAQPSDIAYDSNGYPHIVYFSGNDLRYTYWTGAGWTPAVTIINGGGRHSCKIVVAPNNNVYLLYSVYNIYYQQIGSEKIEISGVETYSLDFKIDGNNNIYVVYSNDTGIYYYDGTNSTRIDPSGGENADVSIALDSNNNPHIVYSTGVSLKYAVYNGSQWGVTTIDYSGDVGLFCSIAIDDNDVVHISYYDNDNDNLKYAKLE